MESQRRMQMDKQEAKLHAGTGERGGAQQLEHGEPPPNPSATDGPPSVPSSSSSPSHEFSFTISLHPSTTAHTPSSAAGKTRPTPSPPASAVDLSPADEIFFHGHLLPLHLLSHFPAASSPRTSTNSTGSFALPAKEPPPQNTSQTDPNLGRAACAGTRRERNLLEGRGSGKSKSNSNSNSKSFSLFGLPRWSKPCDPGEKRRREGQNRKSKFDLTHFLQKYLRLIKPFISRGDRDPRIRRESYSFSGNLKFRSGLKGLRGRREFSAPPSIGTSPTNSGLLVASGNRTPATNNHSASDSTMEELQAAIQAAIAHCKKSIAEDKQKLP